MNTKEIIIDYLKANNFDGLCNPDCESGCGLDDIFPCDCFELDCRPAHKFECPKHGTVYVPNSGECAYCAEEDFL